MNTQDMEKVALDSIKSQKVRVFDTYLLGPFLLFAATRKRPLGKWEKRTLFTAGVFTVIYNWNKYRTLKSDLSKISEAVIPSLSEKPFYKIAEYE